MRIVFLSYIKTIEFYQPENWIKRIEPYLDTLEELSKKNQVIRIDQINYSGINTFNGIEYHFLDLKKRKSFFPFKLHRYVKKLKPDVAWIDGLHFPLQTLQLKMKLRRSAKIIVQHHAEKPFTGLKKLLQRLASKYVDAYFFASAEIGKEWVEKGNLTSLNKVHEVMEVSSSFQIKDKSYAREKTKIYGEPVFLWVGRLNKNKDPLTMVKAFVKLLKSHPLSRLYMIYHTEELLTEIKKIIQQDQLQDSILLVGKLPHDDLQYWFNSADFYVSASHYEGSGTALCEAMSCGCIPIVTNIPSFKTITLQGRCGFLYNPGDEENLLSALQQAVKIDVEEKRNEVAEQFNKHFSFEAIAAKIQSILSSLVK